MNSISRHRLAMCGLYAALVAIFCAPLFEQPLALGVTDWDIHFYYGAVLQNAI